MKRIGIVGALVVLAGFPLDLAAGSGEQDVQELSLKPKDCPPGSRLVQIDHPDQGYTQACMDSRGRQHGWALMWYPDGQAKDYSEAVQGKMHGKTMGWYQNGKLEFACEFDTGERHGAETTWYDNGQMRSQGNYSHGFREGSWKYWFPNGRLRKQGRYQKGITTGKWEYFKEDGTGSSTEVVVKRPKKPASTPSKEKPQPPAPPAKSHEAGVLVGGSLLAKQQVIEDPGLGSIKQIAPSQSASGTWFVGAQGALLANSRYAPVRSVKFSHHAMEASVLDIDGDGEEEFLLLSRVFGHHMMHLRSFLLNSQGEERPVTPAFKGGYRSSAGDLDGDGRLEIAGLGVWRRNDADGFEQGILVQAADGTVVRKVPAGGLSRVFMLDLDGNGRHEIASLDRRGHLQVHDLNGKARTVGKVAPNAPGPTLCPWPDRSGRQRLLNVYETSAWLTDFAGKAPIRFDLPLAHTGSIAGATAIPVRLRATHPPYLAVAVRLRQPGSLLYILTPKGTVEYLEVIDEPVEALGISVSGRGEEALLVGGKGRAWSYRFNQEEYKSLAKEIYQVFAPGPADFKLLDVKPRNVANQVREGWFEWTIYLEGDDDTLSKIACVQYSLHPGFPDPNQLVCDRGGGPRAFALKREGWGTFRTRIRIFLKTGPVQEMDHMLKF